VVPLLNDRKVNTRGDEMSELMLRKKWNRKKLSMVHGAFFVASGLWPLISMRTFEKVTGPKEDDWLVKTVGLLIAVSGATLLRSGLRSTVSDEIALNSAGQAFALGSISLIYSLKGRISKVYLLDTTIEYALVALWYKLIQSKTVQQVA
jgi:hypothetical protein